MAKTASVGLSFKLGRCYVGQCYVGHSYVGQSKLAHSLSEAPADPPVRALLRPALDDREDQKGFGLSSL
jgi:hypothetical protein